MFQSARSKMNGKPSTAKEALVAELLGDVQVLIDRVEKADASTKATADALNDATNNYRQQVDDMTARLRSETANIILKTTEHAAKCLVGQQSATLQKAAAIAMTQALNEQLLKRTRNDWFLAAAIGGSTGAVVYALLFFMGRWV